MKKLLTFLTSVLAYLFLVIDRLTLVPFPFISSPSAQDWNIAFNTLSTSEQAAVNRKLLFAIFRVVGFIITVIIILLIRWLV